MPFRTKDKGARAWVFKGEVGNSHSNYLVNKFLLCHLETMGHRRKYNTQALLFLPACHI